MSGALTDVAQVCGLFDVSSHFYQKLLLQHAVCLTVFICVCVCVLNMVRVCGCSVEEVKRALLPFVHQPLADKTEIYSRCEQRRSVSIPSLISSSCCSISSYRVRNNVMWCWSGMGAVLLRKLQEKKQKNKQTKQKNKPIKFSFLSDPLSRLSPSCLLPSLTCTPCSSFHMSKLAERALVVKQTSSLLHHLIRTWFIDEDVIVFTDAGVASHTSCVLFICMCSCVWKCTE